MLSLLLPERRCFGGDTHSMTSHVEAPPTFTPHSPSSPATNLYEVNIYNIVNGLLLSSPSELPGTEGAWPFFALFKGDVLCLCIYYFALL